MLDHDSDTLVVEILSPFRWISVASLKCVAEETCPFWKGEGVERECVRNINSNCSSYSWGQCFAARGSICSSYSWRQCSAAKSRLKMLQLLQLLLTAVLRMQRFPGPLGHHPRRLSLFAVETWSYDSHYLDNKQRPSDDMDEASSSQSFPTPGLGNAVCRRP